MIEMAKLLAMEPEELDRRASELETELKEMPSRLQEAYQELFNLRFRHVTRQLKDTSQLRKARKAVARIKTAMSEAQKESVLIEQIRHERAKQ